MKILITNHWLRKWGGSETFTYTLVGEAVRQGHEVDLFTIEPGIVSNKIKSDFGVNLVNESDSSYDLILANHKTTVNSFRNILTKTIQTCHGTIPKLEQPNHIADIHVSISEEVSDYLWDKYSIGSKVIRNGIDCQRFRPKKDVNTKPKKVLSMVFSDKANKEIAEACKKLGIGFESFNKHKNPVFNIEDKMNDADLVIGLGRCVYEAMATGRPVIVYDARPYMPSYADGYLDSETLGESIKNNCSGRRYKKQFTSDDLVREIQKYNCDDSDSLRRFALEELNIEKQFNKYLEL